MSDSIDSSKMQVCSVCGVELSGAGLCPRCLMADAAQPTQSPGTGPGSVPPSLEEVTAAFPQFEIIELIGTGGMGTVWRARQPTLNRHVALKLLPESLAERDPAFAERFEREGQLLARLHHPNIVTVHDSGRAGKFFYLLMEFVAGVNLRQAMRASRFTSPQALAIVPKICDALQYAHEEGVLHRDIKPENILLDAKGRVKLVDFGIAKLMAQSEPAPAGNSTPSTPASFGQALTQDDSTLGTPNYMAPEQIAQPADVDHRADIYSLGVVFYELLTGELPLGKFAPPSERSAADPRLDGIVRQALEQERTRRQQSVAEVRTQVETVTGTPAASVPEPVETRLPWKMPPVVWRDGRPVIHWPVVCNQLAFQFGVQVAIVLLLWLVTGGLFSLAYCLLLVVINTMIIGGLTMSQSWKTANPATPPARSTRTSLVMLLLAVWVALVTGVLFYLFTRIARVEPPRVAQPQIVAPPAPPVAPPAVNALSQPLNGLSPPEAGTPPSTVRERLAVKADASARQPFASSKWSPIGPFDESAWTGKKVPTKSGADWSPLGNGPGVEPGGAMVIAHAGLGDTFPIQEPAGHTLAEVFVAEAGDTALHLEVRSREGTQKIELQRDQPVSIPLGGQQFTFLYPTISVDAKQNEDPTTTQAMILIRRRP